MKKLYYPVAALAAVCCSFGQPTPVSGGAVKKIIAGSGISVSPSSGIGNVTVTSTATGGTVTSVTGGTSGGITITFQNTTSTPSISSIVLADISPTTVDGLTFTAASVGFTIAGGTTSKTLTVSNNATVNQDVSTAGSPSFVGTTTSGIDVKSGATVLSGTPVPSLAIDVTKAANTKSVSGDTTFTFTATPANTDQWFSLWLKNTDTSAHTITIPSSFSINRGVAITTFTAAASSQYFLSWRYDGSGYELLGDPVGIDDLTLKSAPVDADELQVADSAAGNISKKTTVGDLTTTITTAGFIGTAATPSSAGGTLTLTQPVTIIYVTAGSTASTWTLPAASASKGKAVEIIVAVGGAHHVNFQPNSGEAFYFKGAALTADHYIQDASSATTYPFDFIWGSSDGTNWSFQNGTGYSGTWADAASP